MNISIHADTNALSAGKAVALILFNRSELRFFGIFAGCISAKMLSIFFLENLLA